MPKYSGVTFAVQPVEQGGTVSGYVISGFVSKEQLATIREFVDTDRYEKSKRWRGQYLEMAKAMIASIDGAVPKK